MQSTYACVKQTKKWLYTYTHQLYERLFIRHIRSIWAMKNSSLTSWKRCKFLPWFIRIFRLLRRLRYSWQKSCCKEDNNCSFLLLFVYCFVHICIYIYKQNNKQTTIKKKSLWHTKLLTMSSVGCHGVIIVPLLRFVFFFLYIYF